MPGVVSVAQMVEHQIVVLSVAGSSPVAHPIKWATRFVSYFTERLVSGCGAAGSALALGARGRQFESDRPDHFLYTDSVPVAQLDRATDF